MGVASLKSIRPVGGLAAVVGVAVTASVVAASDAKLHALIFHVDFCDRPSKIKPQDLSHPSRRHSPFGVEVCSNFHPHSVALRTTRSDVLLAVFDQVYKRLMDAGETRSIQQLFHQYFYY